MQKRAGLLAFVLVLGSCKTLEQIANCEGDLACIEAAIHGYVKDNSGYQEQSFGGMGSAAATTHVQLGSISADGTVQVVATAMVMDGRYNFDHVPMAQSNL